MISPLVTDEAEHEDWLRLIDAFGQFPTSSGQRVLADLVAGKVLQKGVMNEHRRSPDSRRRVDMRGKGSRPCGMQVSVACPGSRSTTSSPAPMQYHSIRWCAFHPGPGNTFWANVMTIVDYVSYLWTNIWTSTCELASVSLQSRLNIFQAVGLYTTNWVSNIQMP